MENNFKLIAEIGCVHIGSLERAKDLANLAKISGADAIKTQKRNPYKSVKKELWDKPHPNNKFAYGDTYLEHRLNLELSIEEHIELNEYCKSINLEYSTSVWDMDSTKEVANDLKIDFIKVPSACNNNKEIIKYLFENYAGEIHISTGMLDLKEREDFYTYIKSFKELDRFVIYHCTSGYPVPFEQLYLNEIKTLKDNFPKIGYSNHGYGIATEIAALCLGVSYFERHFIDDRTFPHTDSSPSLEPSGLYKLKRDLSATIKSLKYKPIELDKIEKEQKDKLKI